MVEHFQEKTGRAPVLVIGEAPALLGSSLSSVSGIENLILPAPDQYFLLHLPENELGAAADHLFQQGIPSDQILICQRDPLRLVFDPLVGVPELLEGDNAEELRQRLLVRLETQRHRKLGAEIERARQRGIPSELSAGEWYFRMEAAHLTHAFSCSLDLSPARHGRSIRLALESPAAAPGTPWEKQLPLEDLLPLCAKLALQHWKSPAAFREEFRRSVASHSFRTRTELRDVTERCMEAVWKGAGHVA